MYIATLLLLLTIPAVLGFTIPKDQPDGLYSVSYDDAGVEIHTLIQLYADFVEHRDVDTARRNATSENLEKRQCGGSADIDRGTTVCLGVFLNSRDTDSANGVLDATCGTGFTVKPGSSTYAKVECTAAYFCNFGDFDDLCYRAEREAVADNKINPTCVPYWAAYLHTYPLGTNRRDFEYGWVDICGNNPGAKFCGHGPNRRVKA